jgi:opacity protein-like surface antigen
MTKFLILVALAISAFAVANSASAFAQGGWRGGISGRNIRPYVQTQTESNNGYQSYAMVPNFYGLGRHNPASSEFGAASER